MSWHWHRWTKWRVTKHYTDVSWGGHADSSQLTRRCTVCGLVKSKGLYGVTVPIDRDEEATR